MGCRLSSKSKDKNDWRSILEDNEPGLQPVWRVTMAALSACRQWVGCGRRLAESAIGAQTSTNSCLTDCRNLKFRVGVTASGPDQCGEATTNYHPIIPLNIYRLSSSKQF